MQSHRRLRLVGLLFSLQAGTTFLRPSVPSQTRDWSTVIIQPTHIPQHQGSKAGAATSNSLSHGHVSRMWCQNRDDQRSELLDALRVETAKVKPESEKNI